MKRQLTIFLIAAAALVPSPVNAQTGISFDVRGAFGVPNGDFSNSVSSDFGFGVGAVLGVTSSLGIYGGWARDGFACDALLCDADSKVNVSGVEAGAKLILPTAGRSAPWLKVGVVGHKMTADAGSVSVESDRKIGFQAAVGMDLPLGEVLSVSPAVRFTTIDPGEDGLFEDPAVRYFSIDLGAHFHVPGG